MLLTDSNGIPVGVEVHSASPHEVTLIESLLSHNVRWANRARRLIYDKAADSATLRRRVRRFGLRLIAPYRRRVNQKTARRLPLRDRNYYAIRY